MYLRDLQQKDAEFMLEWMHDVDVVGKLRNDFASKTIDDVRQFIKDAKHQAINIHMAICSDEDEYMGTVSLKNIDAERKCAEFAIVVRKVAMKRGYAWYGMEKILKIAFQDLQMENVYWCVSRENTRAVRFYDKHNFHEVLDIPLDVQKKYEGINNLKWYSVLKRDQL